MEKKKIALIFGGQSSEHEVSCWSVVSVFENIPREKYDVVCIGITKDGRWLRYDGPSAAIADGSWEKDASCCPAFLLSLIHI